VPTVRSSRFLVKPGQVPFSGRTICVQPPPPRRQSTAPTPLHTRSG